MLATWTFQRNITLLLGRMELIVVELDAGAELNAIEHAEVLGGSRVRQMERGRDGRRESQGEAHGASGQRGRAGGDASGDGAG
jgi:hypothetical protein